MPKDHKITRATRRAASKEALKQMKNILIGDDKRYEISSDDDDVSNFFSTNLVIMLVFNIAYGAYSDAF